MATQPIVIRFADNSIADLRLTIDVLTTSKSNSGTGVAKSLSFTHSLLALKHAIRTHLPSTQQSRSLRLIQAGRVLVDGETIEQSLRLKRKGKVDDSGIAGQGKSGGASSRKPASAPPIYVHCVIGAEDVDTSVLSAEADAAAVPAPSMPQDEDALDDSITTTISSATSTPRVPSTRTHTPQLLQPSSSQLSSALRASAPSSEAEPQGFTRLLSAGFTPQDVATLRAQFRAQTAARHTPDTMPSADALLRMEERWLDGEASASTASTNTAAGVAAGAGAGTAGTDEEDTPGAALNDMLLGVVSGFFWPVGAAVWGLREEGVWSRRRSWAVLGGVAVNVAFGVVRVLG